MTTIMTGIANFYADAYTQTAGWITAHPVITGVSVIFGAALLVLTGVILFRAFID